MKYNKIYTDETTEIGIDLDLINDYTIDKLGKIYLTAEERQECVQYFIKKLEKKSKINITELQNNIHEIRIGRGIIIMESYLNPIFLEPFDVFADGYSELIEHDCLAMTLDELEFFFRHNSRYSSLKDNYGYWLTMPLDSAPSDYGVDLASFALRGNMLIIMMYQVTLRDEYFGLENFIDSF